MGLLALAWRLARRELRGGLGNLGIFVGCLALGVAVIAAVGSLSASVEASLKRDAKALLGGDVELHLALRPIDEPERAFLQAHGTVSAVAGMRAMARTLDGAQRSLIDLKAPDGAYPLYGSLTMEPPGDLAGALARRQGVWGVVVAQGLLDRLHAHVGDRIKIADAEVEIRAVVTHEPDALGSGIAFGPRVMMAFTALGDTGLLAPGVLVGYDYRVRLPAGADIGAFVDEIKAEFPDAGWHIRQSGNAAPSLDRLLDRLTVFLTLVGLTALLVGGVGVGNAVRGYLADKVETIATLKCLGAERRLVVATYLAEILVLAAIGIAIGLVIGALAPLALLPLLPAQLPVTARFGVYPLPLLLAAAFGVLTTLAFALWPLAEAGEIAPASLFRNLVDGQRRRPPLRYVAAVGSAGVALAALAVGSAAEHWTALWFILGAGAALLAFRLAAAGLMLAARRAGRPQRPTLRLALTNLYRPGAPTAGVVASLGLGLTVLVAIALVEGNIAREVDEELPDHAPSFFFVDIQRDQVAAFDKLMAATPGLSQVERVATLRGRISMLNGVPVDKATIDDDGKWAIRSERGVTYSATVPRGSRVVAGTWWPPDYKGPPLVSFDAGLARSMGLKVGDTLTVNVLGREITATIANLREIDWTSLGINFTIVMAPGLLEAAPQTFIATARTAQADEAALERAVTDRFPNVSAIPVKDALASFAGIIAAIGIAMRATAGVTLLAGALVLAGAIAAEHRRRVYQAVVLKVLGATRGDVSRAFLIEYGLIGLAAATLAAVIGSLAGYLVLTRVMHTGWTFLPLVVVATAGLATLLTLGVGFGGTWRALGVKAAPYLRND
jgi:putative ABC transport system permease protein